MFSDHTIYFYRAPCLLSSNLYINNRTVYNVFVDVLFPFFFLHIINRPKYNGTEPSNTRNVYKFRRGLWSNYNTHSDKILFCKPRFCFGVGIITSKSDRYGLHICDESQFTKPCMLRYAVFKRSDATNKRCVNVSCRCIRFARFLKNRLLRFFRRRRRVRPKRRTSSARFSVLNIACIHIIVRVRNSAGLDCRYRAYLSRETILSSPFQPFRMFCSSRRVDMLVILGSSDFLRLQRINKCHERAWTAIIR